MNGRKSSVRAAVNDPSRCEHFRYFPDRFVRVLI
jgi:hypothetical protein